MRKRVFFHFLLYMTYSMEIEKLLIIINEFTVSIKGLDHSKSEQNLSHLV